MARILIVDGDPASREPLEQALLDEGLDVAVAADPDAGWEASSAFAPGVVVLGRRLPRAGAEELIVRLRRADPRIRFVAPSPPWPDMARRLRVELGAPAPRSLSAAPAPVGPETARVLGRPALEAGPLAFGALADLLTRLWRTAADGIVAVERPDGTDRIFLLRGVTVAVHLDRAGPAADPADAVAALCVAGDGSFGFHPGSEFAGEIRGMRAPALSPLLAGLRRAADEPSYAAALADCVGRTPRRAAATSMVLRELSPDADDRATLAAIEGGATVGELLRSGGRPASLLWFLFRAGGAGLAPPEPVTREATAPHAPA